MTNTKKSIGISFATQYMELVIHFLAVMALARILSPDEIGTYSVAAFLMALLHVFRDFGVVQYVIQERELDNEKIRSAMGVAIILALAVALVLLACSGLVADFYANPDIKEILVVMSASFAISPLGALLQGIFRREMQLQKIFYIKLVSSICHVAVAVSLAIWGYGAISLAWANFAGILSFGVVANLMRPPNVPWMPRFTNIRAILSFGSVASLGNAANTAGTNIHELVIGKVMNMAAVGYFSRATGLVQLFTRLITSALLPISLPYFSQLRREGKDLVGPYLTAVEQLTALAWPFFAALMLMALPMVRALYGPQWDASVPIVELLCLAGAISSVSLFATQVMVANGQVRNSTYSHLLTQPFRIIAVFFASAYGLIPIAVALIASECLTLLIVSWFLHKAVGVGPIALIRACGKSLTITLCSIIVPLIVKLAWQGDSLSNPWVPLLLGICGAAIGWLGSLLLTRHPLWEHLRPIFRSAFAMLAFRITRTKNLKLSMKLLAYQSGLLGAYHRFRNRGNLTVVMFHRVLPTSDPRYPGADPEWTMTTESFAHCLRFFRRHYRVVTPEQVFAALRGEKELPGRSLLVTFDDGWADTAEYAHPILDEFSIRALVFVAGSAVNQASPFWEECIYSLLATHPGGLSALQTALREKGIELPAPLSAQISEKNIKEIISQLGQLERDVVLDVAASMTQHAEGPPSMINTDQLCKLLMSSHTIGGHGMTHQPLTKVQDLDHELKHAQGAMSAYLSRHGIESMSFPHGAYSDAVIKKCRSAGYRYLFSSDARLIPIGERPHPGTPVGRIHLSERAFKDDFGRFQPALLAAWLFLRPLRMQSTKQEAGNG